MPHTHTQPAPGQSRPFHFQTRWQLPASAARVWEVLADVGAWPQWWPGVTNVTVLDSGNVPHGAGTRAQVQVVSPVGYRLRFTIHICDVEHPWVAHIDVTGDLQGHGLWRVIYGDESTTHTVVELTWCVVTARKAVRALRPVAGVAHAHVMSGGQRGLITRLAEQGQL